MAYSRYMVKAASKEDSVEAAIGAAQAGNEHGMHYAIGVYDPHTNTAHLPGLNPVGTEQQDFRRKRLDDLRSLAGLSEDHCFDEVLYFPNFPSY